MVLKYSRPKRSKTKTKTSALKTKTKTKTKTLAHETKTKTITCQMGLETVSRPRHVSRPNITASLLEQLQRMAPQKVFLVCQLKEVFLVDFFTAR